jgi:hypothetical protein
MKSLYLLLAMLFLVLVAEATQAQTFRQRTVIRGGGNNARRQNVNVFVNSGFPVQQVNFVPASTFVTPNAIYGVNGFGFNTFAAPAYGCGGFAPSGFRSFSVYSGGGCW